MSWMIEKSEPSPERRPARRRRVLLPGMIVFGNGTFTCDCNIRSLSATGARISVAGQHHFGGRVFLINIREGLAYDAQVIWSKDTDIGLKFNAMIALSTTTDPGFSRLKKLWLAKRIS
jgi:hypothetical protein